MKRITDYIFLRNKGSIIYKNFVIIALTVALPFCLLCSGLFALVYNNAIDNEYFNNYTSAYTTISAMDNFYSQTKRSLIALSENETIKKFVTSKRLVNYDEVQELITTNIMANDYIDSIYVYSSLNRYVISNGYTNKIDIFYDKGWLEGAGQHDENEKILIQVRDKYDSYPHLITFIFPLNEKADMNNHVIAASGSVVINVDADKLCMELFGTQNARIGLYVFNHAGKPAFYHGDDLSIRNMNYTDFKQSYIKEKTTGKSFLLEMELDGYRYICIKPEMSSIGFIVTLIVILMLLFVFITFLVSYILARKTFKPIEYIAKSMSLKRDDDAAPVDELQYIIDNINSNIKNTQLLQGKCEERMQLLNKVYMSALQMQINPHFIYNSLEIINFKAYDIFDGENDISRVAVILSSLLRFSLDTEHKLVSAETEFEYVKKYTEVLDIRFPGKCQYEFVIDEDVKNYAVPKLILQPLVENAFNHGVQSCQGIGKISVTAEPANEKLIITVSNTGKNLTAENLESIKDKLIYSISLDSKHIGIQNVQSRIKLLAGEEYGITDVNCIDNITTFRIELPKID